MFIELKDNMEKKANRTQKNVCVEKEKNLQAEMIDLKTWGKKASPVQ